MQEQFSTKEIPAQAVMGIRTTTPMEKIGEVCGTSFPELHQHIIQSGHAPAGMPLSIYHSMENGVADLECAIPVAEPVASTDRIRPGVLPAGTVATTTHVGPYDALGATWSALMEWIGSTGRQLAGSPWEVYVTDPGVEPDPSKWRTDIFCPVR